MEEVVYYNIALDALIYALTIITEKKKVKKWDYNPQEKKLKVLIEKGDE